MKIDLPNTAKPAKTLVIEFRQHINTEVWFIISLTRGNLRAKNLPLSYKLWTRVHNICC